MIPISIKLDAGQGTIVSGDGFDGASVEAVFSSGTTSAVVEVRLNYTGRVGDGVAFSPAAELTAAAPRKAALGVQDAPYIEFLVTTAAAGERAQIELHRYTRAV